MPEQTINILEYQWGPSPVGPWGILRQDTITTLEPDDSWHVSKTGLADPERAYRRSRVVAYAPVQESEDDALLSKTHWTSNGEAGDGQDICDVCGVETDTGHMHAECHKNGESTGHFTGYHQALEDIAKRLCGAYEGENLDDLVKKLQESEEQWVPVTERLPESGACVMFWVADWLRDSCPGVGPYQDGERGAYWSDETQMEGPDGDSPRYYSGGKNGVSHWRPLPQPPKEST